MKIQAIYDNGGATLDRYTVVTDQQDGLNFLMMLGLSEGGDGFSQWSGGSYAAGRGEKNQHLGKRVSFESLSAATQSHIARRVFTEE
jgi:hypothetical protein